MPRARYLPESKKICFLCNKGRLLSHIVSHEGIRIDPERVKAIHQLNLPASKTGTKSFFGQVNFLWRFIPDFSEITKCIVDMMKGSQSFKWSDSEKKAFELIKHAIARAPTLVHPDYTKEFILYCYASAHTLFAILMQENNEGIQAPIAFMSTPLKDHELRFSQMEKHAYAVVRALKNFRFYVLHSHSVIYVPDSAVKSILTQQEIGCNTRVAWIAKVQEYDIDLKPTRLVRGNGLCKTIAENQKVVQEDDSPKVLTVSLLDPWFANNAYFLTYGDCPEGLTYKQRRDLKIKAAKYVIYDDKLYKRAVDGTFLRCVDAPQQERLLKAFQSEACEGHFSSTVTAYKILRQCYY